MDENQSQFAIIPIEVLKHAFDEKVVQDLPATAKALANTIDKTEEFLRKRDDALPKEEGNPDIAEIFIFDADREEKLPGKSVWDEVRGGPFPIADEQSARALNNARRHRNFLAEVDKRNSLDGKGVNLRCVVRFGDKMVNAFQTMHEGRPIMVYGEGDGKAFLDFTLSYNVAAHEGEHAITAYEACIESNSMLGVGLQYHGMSGALNEMFSDVRGICAQHRFDGTDIAASMWLIGPEIIGQLLKDQGWQAIRTFKNEKAYPKDSQPKHMKNLYLGIQDNAGVHINSGIVNHLFYLFCCAGFDAGIVRYSWEQPNTIWKKARRILPHPMANFWDFKTALIQATQELHPELLPQMNAAIKGVGL